MYTARISLLFCVPLCSCRVEMIPSNGFSNCIHPVVAALIAGLLLGYPIRVQPVHPIVQLIICSLLSTIGLSIAISFTFCGSDSDVCSSCDQWTMYISAIVSLATVIVPAVGAMIGLAVAAGLFTMAFVDNAYLVSLMSACGLFAMFAYRDLLLHWQLVAPPIVGGYFAAVAAAAMGNDQQHVVWVLCALVSLSLHIRRRRVASWLDQKHDQALYSEESQIVQVMRSSNPTVSVEEFDKMKLRLLQVVEGDHEQADRIVYGGGLY